MNDTANARRIIVCCPGSAVTGGPECLHQLVHELRGLGHDAYICYYPFNKHYECPKAYQGYDAPQIAIDDREQDLVILPEIATLLTREFQRARVGIWWLSIDNYFRRNGDSRLKDLANKYLYLYKRRLPLFQLKKYLNLSQSAYARNFLLKHGIESRMLNDYLAPEHLLQKPEHTDRENIIAYNPKKGIKTTSRLIASCPDLHFVPIQDMTKSGVAALLSRAKIYMDFGHHPGRDRLPREAAAAGCCIITGMQGSARNDEDIPIPGQYKFNDEKKICVEKFRNLVESIFTDFDSHFTDFDVYRSRIHAAQQVFRTQVIDIFALTK